jgi:membrane-associated phospholipid phosphatase
MKKVDPKSIYQTISLYEFCMLFAVIFLAIGNRNLFLAAIAATLILKQIPEKILKFTGIIPEKYNKRPSDAFDCNMINKGGDASMNPGFPSGHTTVASFLFFISLFQYLSLKKSGINIFPLVALTGVFLLLIGIARIKLSCHTAPQVFGGFILGLIIALLYNWLDKKYFSKNKKYVSDKATILNLFKIQ